jgi:hypothetical protein
MLSKSDVQKVFKEHVTKYQQQTIDTAAPAGLKTWRWSCSCGQDKILDTREMCVTETNNHWALKVVELQPAEELASEPQGDSDKPTVPESLGIMSYVVREVDLGRLNMPQGRKLLSEWVQRRKVIPADVRGRLRRLKQITDAIYEEVSTTLASESQQNNG